MGSWSDLPYDLLEIIAKKLHHKELLYFGFVCKPWRLLYLENRCRLPADLPISLLTQPQPHRAPFLLKSCKMGSDSRKYVCVVDEKVQGEIFLPEAANKWICGSSQGWLVTREIKGYAISLLNPFTRCEIKLPSLATVPVIINVVGRPDNAQRNCIDFICKAIVSADPITNPQDCVVMALVGEIRRLCFCKLGDTEWTNINDSPGHLHDVIHYQDRFYATSPRGEVTSYDAKNPNAHEVEYVSEAAWSDDVGRTTYLVPLEGELLQIRRINPLRAYEPLILEINMPTVKFEVVKLVRRESSFEKRKCHWSKVESLHDWLIFIGGFNCSFSVSSSMHPNWKGNTTYFGDDSRITHLTNLEIADYWFGKYPFVHHDIGVYDMEDKRMRSYHASEQFDFLPAIWIVPRPW